MLVMYQFIIMLSLIYNHFTFGLIEDIEMTIEETVATIGMDFLNSSIIFL